MPERVNQKDPDRRLKGNQTYISVGRQQVLTLRDILPARSSELHLLFVAKTPAPRSVEAGHYFQGQQGTAFWKKLLAYGLLKPTTEFEDDSLLEHGYGLTDIAKVPRPFGQEPSGREYEEGSFRILDLIRTHNPKAVVFVYKKVLDEVSRLRFGSKEKTRYGFNQRLESDFGTKVFAFPLPGVGSCNALEAESALQALRAYLHACR